MRKKFNIYGIFIAFLIILFDAIDSQQVNNITGNVYLNINSTSNAYIMAQTTTLDGFQNLTLIVRSSLKPVNSDLMFTWSIRPIKFDRFISFDGLGSIKQNEDLTTITISVKDNLIPQLDDQYYTFRIDSILNASTSIIPFSISTSLNSVLINVLPSSYPFGLFEFSNDVPTNFTISRYGVPSIADFIVIKRSFGTLYRVLIICDEIEIINGQNLYKNSIFIDFGAGDTQKTFSFNLSFFGDQELNMQYPRNFLVKLSYAKLLDIVPYSNDIMGKYWPISRDILPTIGNQSTIRITAIDDLSIIEFTKDSLEVNVNLITNQPQYITLNLSRSIPSTVFPTPTVEFVTYAAFGNKQVSSLSTYSAALEFIDYSPISGKILFINGRLQATLNFTLFQNIDYNTENLNRSFQINLVNILDCDSCKLGLNKQAFIYLNVIKQQFKNLLQFNATQNPITLIYNSTNSNSLTVCFSRIIDKPLIMNYRINFLQNLGNIQLLSFNGLTLSNDNTSNINMNDPFIFDEKIQQQCLQLRAIPLPTNLISTCFRQTYALSMLTSYILNQDAKLYSPILTNDTYLIQIINPNCLTISLSNLVIINNNQTINGSKIVIQYDANRTEIQTRIPLVITNPSISGSQASDITLRYNIQVDSPLSSYLSFDQNQTLRLTVDSLNRNFTNTSINFSLINLRTYPYNLLTVSLRIFRESSGLFAISDTDKFLNEQLIIYNYVFNRSSQRGNIACGVYKINKQLTKFFLLNLQRNLYLAIDGEQTSPACIINLNYSITYLNSNKSTNKSIHDFIENISDNYFYVFTPGPSNIKQIPIKLSAYVDENDSFLISLNAIGEVSGRLIQPVFNSLNDTQMQLQPQLNVANGDAQFSSNFISNPSKQYFDNDQLFLRAQLSRNANYSKAQALYQLYIFNASNISASQFNNQSLFYQASLVLNHGDSLTYIDIDLNTLNASLYRNAMANLFWVGQICFYTELNVITYCSKLNDTLLTESVGIFQFRKSNVFNTIQLDDYTQNSNTNSTFTSNLVNLELNIERFFGTKETVIVYYTITTNDAYVDLFFVQNFNNSNENYLLFNANEMTKKLILTMNPIYTFNTRTFYVILTKTTLNSLSNLTTFPLFDNDYTFKSTSKISKRYNTAKIVIKPSTNSIRNIIAFNKIIEVVPFFINNTIRSLKLQVNVQRIQLINDSASALPIECKVRSIGYGQTIPRFILAFETDQSQDISFTTLARENIEFLPVNTRLTFKSNQIETNFTITLLNNFQPNNYDLLRSLGEVKVLYLYLSEPSNTASMIEPNVNSAYSPFTKLRIHKIVQNLTNSLNESIIIGFSTTDNDMNLKLSLNELKNRSYNVRYVIETSKIIRNQLISPLYQVKWSIEFFLNNLTINSTNVNNNIFDFVQCPFTRQSVKNCENVINCPINSTKCWFDIQFKVIQDINSNLTFKIEIMNVNSFTNQTYFNLSVSNTNIAYLNIYSNIERDTYVRFTLNSLFTVQEKLSSKAIINIERIGRINVTTTVFYETNELKNLVSFMHDGLMFYTADADIDFETKRGTLVFDPFVNQTILTVNLLASSVLDSDYSVSSTQTIDSLDLNLYPRMFQIRLLNCTPDCAIPTNFSLSNVTIVLESADLWKMYANSLTSDNFNDLNELKNKTEKPEPPLSSIEIDLIGKILQRYIDRQQNMIDNLAVKNITQFRNDVFEIICNLMNPNRIDTYGRIDLVKIIENLLFSVSSLNKNCITNSSQQLNGTRFNCKNAHFVYAIDRISRDLNSITYNGLYYRAVIPLNYNTFNGSCPDVCVVELISLNWLHNRSSYNVLLKKRAISITVNLNDAETSNIISNSSLANIAISTSRPVIIQQLETRSIQTRRLCSILNTSNFDWNSNVCTTSSKLKYIECTCNHRSIYGIAYQNPTYYGYNYTGFFITTGCKILAMLFAILSYFICLNYFTFTSFCLMHLFMSIAATQFLYIITIAISSLIIVDEPDGNNASCVTLALFFHYFIITQFSWIFAVAFCFFKIIVKKSEITFKFKTIVLSIGWLSPILIICIFYFIAGLTYRYGYDYSAAFIYSDVVDNRQICFIKNIWTLVWGLIIPCLTFFIAALFIIALMFRQFKIWKNFDSIYKDCSNLKEIIRLLILYSLIFVLNFWACLHIRLGFFWLFVLFCMFDFILSIYVTIAYTLSRHMLSPLEKCVSNVTPFMKPSSNPVPYLKNSMPLSGFTLGKINDAFQLNESSTDDINPKENTNLDNVDGDSKYTVETDFEIERLSSYKSKSKSSEIEFFDEDNDTYGYNSVKKFKAKRFDEFDDLKQLVHTTRNWISNEKSIENNIKDWESWEINDDDITFNDSEQNNEYQNLSMLSYDVEFKQPNNSGIANVIQLKNTHV